MTLVLLAITPLLVLSGAAIAMMTARLSSKGAEAYAEANAIAQDALANVRTVASFNAQKKTLSTYVAVRIWLSAETCLSSIEQLVLFFVRMAWADKPGGTGSQKRMIWEVAEVLRAVLMGRNVICDL